MNTPETRYAKAPDGTSIAFQVVGEGPIDLLFANGIFANVELMWDLPLWAHFLERLASSGGDLTWASRRSGSRRRATAS